MFGIGFSELILIFVVALLVLGPKRLPEVAKTLGRFYREIKSTMDEVKSVVEEDQTKPYYPPHHIPSQTATKTEKKDTWEEEFEEELKKSDKGEYQPKREKITFKKKTEENKEET